MKLTLNRKPIKYIALTIGVAFGILLIPNLPIFDEELKPEIQQLLTQLQTDIFQPDNAAISIYGLAANSGLDAYTVGEQLLRKLHEKSRRNDTVNLSDAELEQLLKGKDLDKHWQTAYPVITKCNPRDQMNCFALGLAELQATPITDKRLIAQQTRYDNIRSQSRYSEDIRKLDLSSPLPDYATALHLSRLSALDAYLENGLDGLIANTTTDMKFWQMVLRDGQTLIDKMVAINALRGNLLAIAYGISRENNLSDEQHIQLQQLLTPLTIRDFNFAAAITAESLTFINANNQVRKLLVDGSAKQWLLHQLTQTNASINSGYTYYYQPVIALSQINAPGFYQHTQLPVAPLKFSRLNPYNLGGKINMFTPLPYYAYLGRGHDLTGIYQLLQLQLALKQAQPADVKQFINVSTYKNPYTTQPFDYDPQHQQLSFRCFDSKDICGIQL